MNLVCPYSGNPSWLNTLFKYPSPPWSTRGVCAKGTTLPRDSGHRSKVLGSGEMALVARGLGHGPASKPAAALT